MSSRLFVSLNAMQRIDLKADSLPIHSCICIIRAQYSVFMTCFSALHVSVLFIRIAVCVNAALDRYGSNGYISLCYRSSYHSLYLI